MPFSGTALVALALIPVAWGEYDPGCWFENSVGDRFKMGADPWVWVYVPASGDAEDCAYGVDPDATDYDYSVTCNSFDAPVRTEEGDNVVSILGQIWTYSCPPEEVSLGL